MVKLDKNMLKLISMQTILKLKFKYKKNTFLPMRPTPYLSVDSLPLEEKPCGGCDKVFDWVTGDL